MAQTTEQVDPQFVTSLRTNISGIYFGQVAHYQAAEIESQFRRAVRDAALVDDEAFMSNLFFLVRKKEVRGLRDDVVKLVTAKHLKPLAQASGLKTAYAIGDVGDRNQVDALEAEGIEGFIQARTPLESSPVVDAADRVGGPRTLLSLNRLYADTANQQRSLEHQSPNDHARISQLDKARAALRRKAAVLSRKELILANQDPDRTAELARVFLQRSVDLSCWALRELLEHASPNSAAIVAGVVANELPSFLPVSGQAPQDRANAELDIKLRATVLLQRLGAPTPPADTKLLSDNSEMMRSRQPFFYPVCDWEDILDRA